MKVKFENCEVELWKVTLGSVVLYEGRTAHIVGILDSMAPEAFENNIYQVRLKQLYKEFDTYSASVEWIAPH